MPVVPVFVSSTFRDFHGERDAIRRLVAPALDAALASLGARVELQDLRWGVDTTAAVDDEQAHQQVLDVCLREIDRCRPLFVGLIGDRFGWVPPRPRLEAAAARAGITRGLPLGVADGLSVTALEFWHGALTAGGEAVFATRRLTGQAPAGWRDADTAGVAWLAGQIEAAARVEPERVRRFDYTARVVDGVVDDGDLQAFADLLVDQLRPLVVARAQELAASRLAPYEAAAALLVEARMAVVAGRDGCSTTSTSCSPAQATAPARPRAKASTPKAAGWRCRARRASARPRCAWPPATGCGRKDGRSPRCWWAPAPGRPAPRR